MSEITSMMIRAAVVTLEAHNVPLSSPTEREAAIEYFQRQLTFNTLSPGRRRMIEAELRKLENTQT